MEKVTTIDNTRDLNKLFSLEVNLGPTSEKMTGAKVRILDRGCGTGKSTRMIEALKRNPRGEKTLLILPLLSEVSRYQEALPRYKSPEVSGKGVSGISASETNWMT